MNNSLPWCQCFAPWPWGFFIKFHKQGIGSEGQLLEAGFPLPEGCQGVPVRGNSTEQRGGFLSCPSESTFVCCFLPGSKNYCCDG